MKQQGPDRQTERLLQGNPFRHHGRLAPWPGSDVVRYLEQGIDRAGMSRRDFDDGFLVPCNRLLQSPAVEFLISELHSSLIPMPVFKGSFPDCTALLAAAGKAAGASSGYPPSVSPAAERTRLTYLRAYLSACWSSTRRPARLSSSRSIVPARSSTTYREGVREEYRLSRW